MSESATAKLRLSLLALGFWSVSVTHVLKITESTYIALTLNVYQEEVLSCLVLWGW